jgi:hypothetical protein
MNPDAVDGLAVLVVFMGLLWLVTVIGERYDRRTRDAWSRIYDQERDS